MKIKILDSNTGFSLTELLVGVGIMGIVALAMATMFASSFNDMRSLKESLAMRDLETRTRQILLRPDYASCLLRGRTLDTTVNPATWNPPIATLPVAYQLPAPAMPAACTELGGILVQPNAIIGDSSARVGTLTMTETLDVGAGNYSATLAIAPDAQSLARSLREIRIPLQFRVDLTSGTPNARPFLSVDLGAAGAGAGAKAVIELKCSHAGSVCVPPACPAGWTVLGTSTSFTAGAGPNWGITESRHCEAPTSGGQVIELKCSHAGSVCVPPACPAGWTVLGTSTSFTAGEGPNWGITESRHCLSP
ncbi:MAG: type II secretion system protein [Bdellovibrionales bacterium]|nr:type II secretion system protein [Bdellovibrionales bacterium]